MYQHNSLHMYQIYYVNTIFQPRHSYRNTIFRSSIPSIPSRPTHQASIFPFWLLLSNEPSVLFLSVGGGLDVDDIHTKKGLEVGQKILDYMGSTELIANLFRISQTEEKLRKDEVDNAKMATSVHFHCLISPRTTSLDCPRSTH